MADGYKTPREAEDAISRKVGEVIDVNAATIQNLRQRSEDFALLGDAMGAMQEWACEMAEACQIKARQLADLAGDFISAEYMLVQVEHEEEEEEEEDGDEDEEQA